MSQDQCTIVLGLLGSHNNYIGSSKVASITPTGSSDYPISPGVIPWTPGAPCFPGAKDRVTRNSQAVHNIDERCNIEGLTYRIYIIQNAREPHSFAFLRYVVYRETSIADLVPARVHNYDIRRKVCEG